MKDLQVFKFQEEEIRVVERDGDFWLVAVDVCRVLGIKDASDAVERLDADEKGTVSTPTPGGLQKLLAVNEFGLYNLIFASRKSEARAFKRWVTHEVLPALRKTGTYTTQPEHQKSLRDTVKQAIADRGFADVHGLLLDTHAATQILELFADFLEKAFPEEIPQSLKTFEDRVLETMRQLGPSTPSAIAVTLSMRTAPVKEVLLALEVDGRVTRSSTPSVHGGRDPVRWSVR